MNGILVSQTLRALLADGAIQALLPLRPDQVQPSSLDLRLGARVWQLQCSFLPGAEGIERKLGRLATTVQRTVHLLDAVEVTGGQQSIPPHRYRVDWRADSGNGRLLRQVQLIPTVAAWCP